MELLYTKVHTYTILILCHTAHQKCFKDTACLPTSFTNTVSTVDP